MVTQLFKKDRKTEEPEIKREKIKSKQIGKNNNVKTTEKQQKRQNQWYLLLFSPKISLAE